MKAMVLLNLATEADIANGTRGEIQNIILDERENISAIDEDGAIKLKYPPAMIVFKPDKKTKLIFQGLPLRVIPLTPSLANVSITDRTGKKVKVVRRQYAMTVGYTFTDYKSQGQTIEYVIIDIGKPPTGALSPFSIYVALSRSRGRDTIHLLRDFDINLFQNHPSEALRTDMKRLEELHVVMDTGTGIPGGYAGRGTTGTDKDTYIGIRPCTRTRTRHTRTHKGGYILQRPSDFPN